MAHIYSKAYFDGSIVPFKDANLSIASSAILYGLSIYTVFHIAKTKDELLAFRLPEHYKRLQDSARIIGIELPEDAWTYDKFVADVKELVHSNKLTGDSFVRVSIHVNELLPGTRSRGIATMLSMFIYDAEPIVPRSGARLKTSLWRRIPDISIPSRAKVNGAYVNSVLARQDAIDSGYDDCIFLDQMGHVCELSAANIFMVRGGTLCTPDTNSDLLEGINRLSVLQLARDQGIAISERAIDLTELYIADEVFITGTSAFLTAVSEIDARILTSDQLVTKKLARLHNQVLRGELASYRTWVTDLRIHTA